MSRYRDESVEDDVGPGEPSSHRDKNPSQRLPLFFDGSALGVSGASGDLGRLMEAT